MNWLWDWLFYGIPFWVQVGILAVPVLIGFYIAVRLLGWERVRGWIPAALIALTAIGALSRTRQQGYADRKRQEDVALDKAEKVVVEERTEVTALPDKQLDDEVDKWSRK
jgi:hypothetical protein